jgi:hypothetical protein
LRFIPAREVWSFAVFDGMDFSIMVRAELVLGTPKFAEVSQDVRKFFFF